MSRVLYERCAGKEGKEKARKFQAVQPAKGLHGPLLALRRDSLA